LTLSITRENTCVSEISEKVTDGTHFTPSYTSEGIVFLSALNVLENRMVFDKYNFISPLEHSNLIKRVNPKVGDILLRKVGVGPRYASVIPSVNFEFSIFVSLALIRLQQKHSNLNYYLSTYINSNYGQNQLLRLNKGISQPDLHLEDIRDFFFIPLPSRGLEEKIKQHVIKADELLNKSKSLLQNINILLTQHIGFQDFTPSKTSHSSRNLKDYLQSGRLDGEYWQPKYDEIEDRIKNYPGGYDTFDNLIHVSSETVNLDAEKSYMYVELSSVNAGVGLIEEPSEMNGNELPSRAKMLLKEDDVILASVEGSSGKVAIVKDGPHNLVGSSGFFVLREKHYLPEVMLALLRVPYINMLVKRQAQGTILTAVPRGSLARVILPKLPKDFQEQIALQIKEAQNLYEMSKKSLELVKRAVDIFVEDNEDKAIEYINSHENLPN